MNRRICQFLRKRSRFQALLADKYAFTHGINCCKGIAGGLQNNGVNSLSRQVKNPGKSAECVGNTGPDGLQLGGGRIPAVNIVQADGFNRVNNRLEFWDDFFNWVHKIDRS